MEPETTDETLKRILEDTLARAEKGGIYKPSPEKLKPDIREIHLDQYKVVILPPTFIEFKGKIS